MPARRQRRLPEFGSLRLLAELGGSYEPGGCADHGFGPGVRADQPPGGCIPNDPVVSPRFCYSRQANPVATRASRANALKRQVPMYIAIAVIVALTILGVFLGRLFLKIDVVDEVFPHKLLGQGIGSPA